MKRVVIIGAGGFAREVLDVFEACNGRAPEWDILGFIVEAGYGVAGEIVNGLPILGDFDWLDRREDDVLAICGVAAPEVRVRMVDRAAAAGVGFCSVVHPRAIVTPRMTIGNGSVVTAGCVLSNQIRIGDHVHVNPDCTIGHDAVCEDFVTLSPGVHVSGNVTLSTGAFVGTGANIVQRLRVGEWSVVGAGCTVTRDVPPNATVVGVPGRVIKTREPGWHLAR